MLHALPATVAAAVLSVTLLPVTGAAHPADQDLHRRIERLAEDVVPHSATGMSVAVVDGSGTEILRAWGHTDQEQDRPLDVDSRMPVASVSKVVTALTALVLHEEDTLDLDAPIEQVSGVGLRDVRAPADRVPLTGRHLLTHHAGIDESALMPPAADAEDLRRPLSSWLAQHPPVVAHPAIGMHYSPLVAHSVLGAAVERSTGTSFAQAARAAVLEPVGAGAATFREAADPADAVMVSPVGGGFEASPWPVTPEAPAASLRWSARDAAALLSALVVDDGRLPPPVVDEALTTSVRPHHGGGGHTQVFFENRRQGVDVLEHAGGNGLAWLALVPDAGVGVFVAVNSDDAAAAEATEAVVEAVVDWTVATGRTGPSSFEPKPAITPAWLPPSRPAAPTGAFHERLFRDHGPERALRVLLGQTVVTADGEDLLLNGRRLVPEAAGRWCDRTGCVAGRISPAGTTVLERGDRGMLEQTLLPASAWHDRRTVVAAFGAWAVVVLVVAVGALRRLAGRVRGRRRPSSPAPGVAAAWAATSCVTLAAVFAVPLWPLLAGTSTFTAPHGPAVGFLTAAAALSGVTAAGWIVSAIRQRHAVAPRRLAAAGVCAALALPAQAFLLQWGISLPG